MPDPTPEQIEDRDMSALEHHYDSWIQTMPRRVVARAFAERDARISKLQTVIAKYGCHTSLCAKPMCGEDCDCGWEGVISA
jgi:hypothetical protein